MNQVRICPKCGSENNKVDFTNPKSAVGMSQTNYLCLDCGFSGPIFPEIEANRAKDTKETK